MPHTRHGTNTCIEHKEQVNETEDVTGEKWQTNTRDSDGILRNNCPNLFSSAVFLIYLLYIEALVDEDLKICLCE